MALYADHEGDNVSWDLPGWEPWEPDEDEFEGDEPGPCAYCTEATEVREYPEPFGGRPCCEACFDLIIGGDDEAPDNGSSETTP